VSEEGKKEGKEEEDEDQTDCISLKVQSVDKRGAVTIKVRILALQSSTRITR
jgi:hypothetical protein